MFMKRSPGVPIEPGYRHRRQLHGRPRLRPSAGQTWIRRREILHLDDQTLETKPFVRSGAMNFQDYFFVFVWKQRDVQGKAFQPKKNGQEKTIKVLSKCFILFHTFSFIRNLSHTSLHFFILSLHFAHFLSLSLLLAHFLNFKQTFSKKINKEYRSNSAQIGLDLCLEQ